MTGPPALGTTAALEFLRRVTREQARSALPLVSRIFADDPATAFAAEVTSAKMQYRGPYRGAG